MIDKNKAKFSVITPVNDGLLYKKFCGKSPNLTDDFVICGNAKSAAAAFNYGMKKAKHDLCVCCHQDVFFPPGWADKLNLPMKFGVVGLYGMDMQGNDVGHIYDPHGYRSRGVMPCEVMSVDELCIIIDRRTGLQFDEELGGWHFYGADICLQAIKKGLKNYVIDNLAIHASGGAVNNDFHDMRMKFEKKWEGKSPIETFHTTCCKVFL